MTARIRNVAAAVALILGAISVGIVEIGSMNPITAKIWRAAEAFASPGELLWWATFGDAFSGYPSGFPGYFLWITGTALFWFVVAMIVLAATARLRTRF